MNGRVDYKEISNAVNSVLIGIVIEFKKFIVICVFEGCVSQSG